MGAALANICVCMPGSVVKEIVLHHLLGVHTHVSHCHFSAHSSAFNLKETSYDFLLDSLSMKITRSNHRISVVMEHKCVDGETLHIKLSLYLSPALY